jgi:hypothetical protein
MKKLKSGLLVLVVLVELLLVLLVGLITHIKIEFQLLKYLELKLMQMGSIDPSSELVGLVVIVKVVLELGSQQD